MNEQAIWQAKLAARLGESLEQALAVWMDDHAQGSASVCAAVRGALFSDAQWAQTSGITAKADCWARAADRLVFPEAYLPKELRITHPLTAASHNLGTRNTRGASMPRGEVTRHFENLIQRSGNDIDRRKTALAFWRFGPELNAQGLKSLWRLLPADARMPDHSIWSHLDLASAFAGAMAEDETPALLSMSFGPVQSFIEQARSTSDLWAGSHLLSRMVWEGLTVLCERLGPDAVLFPQLFGLPLVDAWIEQQLDAWPKGFKTPDWKKTGTDANPLFVAAMPNRFMAIVPASQAEAIAKEVEQTVSNWVMAQGKAALKKLREKSGVRGPDYADAQVERQLADFPECYWCAVPWPPAGGEDQSMDTKWLRGALAGFYPEGEDVGFLDSKAWKLLKNKITVDGHDVYCPNGGVLYPALYDLLERTNASVKAIRPFAQQCEEGYRCTLCGEREWLHVERGDPESKTGLFAPPGARNAKLWKKLPQSWSRKGKEQLCALCTWKRLWPDLFAEEVRGLLKKKEKPTRYVVSTHTMALVGDLARKAKDGNVSEGLKELAKELNVDQVALPAKLARILKEKTRDFALIPGLLDAARDHEEKGRRRIEKAVSGWLDGGIEAYYGFILFDGDKMGAWLQGNEAFTCLRFEDFLPAQLKESLRDTLKANPALADYLKQRRPVSPARHAAISAALNGFALHLARFAVEEAHHGKLLYAGGDDVVAMVPVGELMDCMRLLRLLYAGHVPEDIALPEDVRDVAHGFVRYQGQWLRVMGEKATASAGAVVAHHMAPLQRVLKELRNAEKLAKNSGRDAFCVRVLKRGGGTVDVAARWFRESSLDQGNTNAVSLSEHPSVLLRELACVLGSEKLSRRAAYHLFAQLRELPTPEQLGDEAFKAILEATMARQFRQQGGGENEQELARRLARLACDIAKQRARNSKEKTEEKEPGQSMSHEAKWLEGFIAVAEFMGREGRMGGES